MDWIAQLQPQHGHWTRQQLQDRHAATPELLTMAVREIGEAPAAWAVQTAARIIARLRNEGVLIGVPRDTTGSEIRGCESGLLTALMLIRRGRFEREALYTDPMLGIARIAFRQGMPLDVLSHRVWASHISSQDEMIAAVEVLVPVEEQLRCIQRMNAVMFDYGNSYVRALTEAYEEERRAWHGRFPEERLRIMTEIADGAPPPPDAERVLGASLKAAHLHALVWSGHAGFVDDRDATRDAWAYEAAETLRARRLVTVDGGGMTTMWWSFERSVPANAVATLAGLSRPDWLRVSIGPPGVGLQGFRDSIKGAQLAASLGRINAEGAVWNYSDVAVVAQLLRNQAEAARFVRYELGALSGEGERLDEIRHTTRLYLASGNARSEVAKTLHISPTTVAYRVRQAAELIGRPLADRPLEIRLALELRQGFADQLARTDFPSS